MSPGRILYLAWYRPLGAVRRSAREGGPVAQWITRRGQRRMAAAAARLPPLPPPPADAPEVCFLTGRRFWYQSAFCFWSLARHAGRPLRAVFHDDGTLGDSTRAECARLFPGSRVETAGDIDVRLDAVCPAARLPVLRARRRELILLRKLLDVHAGRAGWRLFLDSDMLFFRRPDVLLDWLAAPSRPIHLVDIQNAYGYRLDLLHELAGAPVPERINTGVLGLDSAAIDWDRLESWCRRLQEAAGTSYYQEQALVALMLAGREAAALPAADYRLMPSLAEARHPTAVMHHYVDLSKRGYFRHAWQAALTSMPAPPRAGSPSR